MSCFRCVTWSDAAMNCSKCYFLHPRTKSTVSKLNKSLNRQQDDCQNVKKQISEKMMHIFAIVKNTACLYSLDCTAVVWCKLFPISTLSVWLTYMLLEQFDAKVMVRSSGLYLSCKQLCADIITTQLALSWLSLVLHQRTYAWSGRPF